MNKEELTKEVAEKVMGWTQVKRATIQVYACPTFEGIPLGYAPGHFRGIPSYAEDIKAAWEVVARIDGQWKFTGQEGVGWIVSVVPASGGDDRYSNPYEGRANTAPEAICLAALKTIEKS